MAQDRGWPQGPLGAEESPPPLSASSDGAGNEMTLVGAQTPARTTIHLPES